MTRDNQRLDMLYAMISTEPIDIPEDLEEEAIDLLEKLLHKDPKERIGFHDRSEIRRHPFFEGVDWEEVR